MGRQQGHPYLHLAALPAGLLPRAAIPAEDWWPHWAGVDYGFNVSQAAAYLLAKSPAGITYVLEEYAAQHQPAADFARQLKERFARGNRKFCGWYLSPDAWSQRGDGHTLADQMTAATGIPFMPASTDRVGGAMLLYSQLDRGEMLIADSCRQLREALPTRIHDPARPDDILKISGDPLDDCVDALRYAAYSYIGPAQPPTALARQRAVTSADPTIAMLQRRLAEERLRVPSSYLPARRPPFR